MWTSKEAPPAVPSTSRQPGLAPISPLTPTDTTRPAGAALRNTAWLGPSIDVKGKISGNEDLYIDGKVEGPISLTGHRLTVGQNAQVSAEVVAREIVVYGKISGNLSALDRIEIKKDGSVTGDLTTTRISIEDGAYFKGRIEIDRKKGPNAKPESVLADATSKVD